MRRAAALCWLLLSAPALANGGGGHADPAKEAAERALAARDAPREVSAQDYVAREPARTGYCANIADAAADARFAWQKEQLAALERDIEERIRRLDEKRAESEAWIAKRNAFLAKAEEGVVAVYAKMRPDAAAPQLATMPEEAAAAILAKLNPRAASAILAEMEAARAAGLARKMSGPERRADPAKGGTTGGVTGGPGGGAGGANPGAVPAAGAVPPKDSEKS